MALRASLLSLCDDQQQWKRLLKAFRSRFVFQTVALAVIGRVITQAKQRMRRAI